MNGIINLDKPAGISSAGAVNRVKRLLPRGVKIGHAGTLDPFATGVLLLLIGKSTKLAEQLMAEPKQYEATLKLGATTETLDQDSPEVISENASPPNIEMVRQILSQFVGHIDQMPPAYSALKLGGVPAYKRARRGETVELAMRKVRIDAIELIEYAWPKLRIRVDCGRGTYIRSLARDIGIAMKTSAYLLELRRTRIGRFTAENAANLDSLARDGAEKCLVDFTSEVAHARDD